MNSGPYPNYYHRHLVGTEDEEAHLLVHHRHHRPLVGTQDHEVCEAIVGVLQQAVRPKYQGGRLLRAA